MKIMDKGSIDPINTNSEKNILTLVLSELFLLSMVSNYYISNQKSTIFFLSNDVLQYLIYSVAFFSFFIYLMNTGVYLKQKTLILFLIFFLLTIVLFLIRNDKKVSIFIRLIGLCPFLFIINHIRAEVFIKRYHFYLIIFFSIFYSVLGGSTFSGGRRFIFNSNDPNFSSVYFLLGFMICNKLNYKVKYVFILLGILTFSRNFLLGILVFYFIKYIKQYKYFSTILKRIHPFIFFIVMQVVVLAFGAWFLLNVEIKPGREEMYSSLNDNSNQFRFLASSFALEYLLTGGRDAFINGTGDDIKGGLSGYVPHNSYLGLFVRMGILYGLINCIVLFAFIKQNNRPENYEYIYSYLVTSIFLGALDGNIFLFCWCYILIVKSRPEKRMIKPLRRYLVSSKI
jgi:hypothetical protein